MATSPDRWSQWLGSRRDGGDRREREATLNSLAPIRDRVLDAGGKLAGATVLDVGCGEGLVGCAALEWVGEHGSVIFLDVSRALIEQVRRELRHHPARARAHFVVADARDLAPVADASVDLLTTRSVLIYVPDKAAAFRAMHRVLRPGGRISLFEPINSLMYPEPPDRFAGYDVGPVQDLATRVKAARFERTAPAANAMIDFDDRDLVRFAVEAGLAEVHLSLEVTVGEQPAARRSFDALLHSAPNPLSPTLRESIDHALDATEAQRFIEHLRAAVRSTQTVLHRSAVAYLTAQRGDRR